MKRNKHDIERAIVLAEGNIRKASGQMGLDRAKLYKYIHRFELWSVVNKAREKRINSKPEEESLLDRTRHALRR